ncbi:MAG: multidrug efflux SMR transporter [Halomonas sp.]|uniref:Guanidinium exporter n=1 Tax=Halomonas sulfidivorans TaxID=2733488 RepID=A0ABX7WEG8_9GAMM|nr:multidrug efflux SMR transporter [Halomonas sulfidivorans]MDX5379614.1 multidrug efflux SMR transporter [Halomonas sp.]QTP57927.1 multidrug efflux SMR transporter [Halomonas sulfidivorans]
MPWILLLGASLLEIVWAMSLNASQGFSRIWPSLIAILAAGASFFMLSLALKSLPIGTAYAIWVGIGTVGVALLGIASLGESQNPLRLLCLALIVTGVAGLKLVDG